MEGQVYLVGEPAGEPEHERVHHKGEQAEGQDVEGAAEDLHDRLDQRVDEAEDQRDDQQRHEVGERAPAADVDVGDDDRRQPESAGGQQELDYETHGFSSPPASSPVVHRPVHRLDPA